MSQQTHTTLESAQNHIASLVGGDDDVYIEVIPQTGGQWTVNWYTIHRNQTGANALTLANDAMSNGMRVDLILQPSGAWTVKSY